MVGSADTWGVAPNDDLSTIWVESTGYCKEFLSRKFTLSLVQCNTDRVQPFADTRLEAGPGEDASCPSRDLGSRRDKGAKSKVL